MIEKIKKNKEKNGFIIFLTECLSLNCFYLENFIFFFKKKYRKEKVIEFELFSSK